MNSPKKQKVSLKRRKVNHTPPSRYTVAKYGRPVILTLITLGVAALGYFYYSFAWAGNDQPGDLYVDFPYNVQSHDVGSTFTLTVNGNIPTLSASELNGSTLLHLNIQTQYMSNTTISNMTVLTGTQKGGFVPYDLGDEWTTGPSTCIEYSTSLSGQNHIALFTLTFTQNTAGSGVHNPYNWGMDVRWRGGGCPTPGENYFSYAYISHSIGILGGSCDQNGQNCDGGGGGGCTSNCGGGDIPVDTTGGDTGGEQGGDDGGGDGKTKNGKKPTTKSKTSTSGSGASATKQSNTQGSVPNASSQGSSTDQTSITPSPFYDGKLYTSGSQTDASKAASLLSRSLQPQKWWLAIPLLLILGGVGLLVWRLKRRRS